MRQDGAQIGLLRKREHNGGGCFEAIGFISLRMIKKEVRRIYFVVLKLPLERTYLIC